MGVLILVLFAISTNIALSAASCSNVKANSVPPQDIKIIVDKHNQLRSLIANGQVNGQPRGINVGNLQWDDALAKEAQKISNTCVFEHVSVKDPRWWWVGQNLGLSGTTGNPGGADWNGIIQSWFDEYKNFKYPSTSNGVTGHYTQVVWADTKSVGCGYTAWEENPWNRKLYVCNYGPGGNIAGQAPYKV